MIRVSTMRALVRVAQTDAFAQLLANARAEPLVEEAERVDPNPWAHAFAELLAALLRSEAAADRTAPEPKP